MANESVEASLQIPKLTCPESDWCADELGREVDGQLAEWVAEMGLFPGYQKLVIMQQFGRFAMLAHPDAVNSDRLLLAAQSIAILFAVDDHYCDEKRSGSDPILVGSRLGRALASIEVPYMHPAYVEDMQEGLSSDPVLRGLSDFIHHVEAMATPAQTARIRSETVLLFSSMSAEASWRLTNDIPSVWEYFAHRQANGALACTALIDVVGGYELPADAYYARETRGVSILASAAITCANDILSAPKELKADIGDYNLPVVLMNKYDCSLQDAITASAAIHTDMIGEYEARKADLLVTATPELSRYLAGLDAWIGGSYRWGLETSRYAK